MRDVKQLNAFPKLRSDLLAGRNAYLAASDELDKARAKRDAAILAASAAGISRRQVAELAGVTVGRVQQLVDAAKTR